MIVAMRRFRTLACLSAAVLMLTLALAEPVGARVVGALAGPSPSSAELSARFGELVAERDGVEAELRATTDALTDARDRIERDQVTRDRAIDAENRAYTTLSRYSVSAYVGGGIVHSDLTAALLAAPDGDIDNEGKRVLSTSVHHELVGRARRATDELTQVEDGLHDAEATSGSAEARAAELAQRRDELDGEIAGVRVAIEQARAAEAAEAAEQARRDEDDRRRADDDARRAATPRPESIRSGVIPPGSVRADIIARLGGEIPRTALDAYWRAARLVNASRPGCDVDWALIAAIGRVETSHGTYLGTVLAPDGSTSPTILGIALDGRSGTAVVRDTDGGTLDGDPVYDRAVGPMQFIPQTWRSFAADGNGDGAADPHNIYDASMATGNYLCATGGGSLSIIENASRAVFAYNRSMEYNAQVLTLADHYRRTLDPSLPPPTAPPTVPSDPGDLPPPASPEPGPEPPPPTSSTTSTSTTTTTAPAAP